MNTGEGSFVPSQAVVSGKNGNVVSLDGFVA
jgi:hypothetical protein